MASRRERREVEERGWRWVGKGLCQDLKEAQRYEQNEKVKAFRLGVCLAYVLDLVSLFAVPSNTLATLCPGPSPHRQPQPTHAATFCFPFDFVVVATDLVRLLKQGQDRRGE